MARARVVHCPGLGKEQSEYNEEGHATRGVGKDCSGNILRTRARTKGRGEYESVVVVVV